MMTLRQFAKKPRQVPMTTAFFLTELGEARGKQELFTKQAPQKLKALREHALIESAVSSTRIEGVSIDPSRVSTVVFGKPVLRDRDEEEVRGYRDALNLIHARGAELPVSEETILQLHRLVRGEIWDAGKYKEKRGDIIERYPDGRHRVRFQTVEPKEAAPFTRELLSLWTDAVRDRLVPPLIALAAFNLDFLCIHPFRDGNGRVSRLLMLLQCYVLGYEVGRYISLERLIEQNKDRYYETLETSSKGWHDGKHDPWPYVNFVLANLRDAYREFERRVGDIASPRGAKTQLVLQAIAQTAGAFHVADLQRATPGVSIDMIRWILKGLRAKGQVECTGRGPQAKWRRTGAFELGTLDQLGKELGNVSRPTNPASKRPKRPKVRAKRQPPSRPRP